MIYDRGRSADSAYLIVVQDALIRQDLAQAVEEVSPDAGIIAVDGLAVAIDAISDAAQLTRAFIEASPDAYHRSPLAERLSALGVRVVLVGTWDERAARADGWSVLCFPFTTQDVHHLL